MYLSRYVFIYAQCRRLTNCLVNATVFITFTKKIIGGNYMESVRHVVSDPPPLYGETPDLGGSVAEKTFFVLACIAGGVFFFLTSAAKGTSWIWGTLNGQRSEQLTTDPYARPDPDIEDAE